jgi:ribosomal protein S1
VHVVADLKGIYGDYLAPDKERAWEHAKTLLRSGDTVTGEVIKQYHFGVFVEIGIGFPALLQVIQFDAEQSRRYTSMSDYPAVGVRISARVVLFQDRGREIVLTQRSPHPYLDSISLQQRPPDRT